MGHYEGDDPAGRWRGEWRMTSMADRSQGRGLRAPEADGAFAARFRESYRPLWLVAVAIVGEATLAEDVVQEAALIALTKLNQFDDTGGRGAFTAWMAQIVRFVALNLRRKAARHNTASVPGEQMDLHAAPGDSAAGDAMNLGRRGELPEEQSWFDDQVMKALAGLPENARACLLLRTLADMEYRDISRVVGVPEGTAMSYVHRARGHLREQLAPPKPSAAPFSAPSPESLTKGTPPGDPQS